MRSTTRSRRSQIRCSRSNPPGSASVMSCAAAWKAIDRTSRRRCARAAFKVDVGRFVPRLRCVTGSIGRCAASAETRRHISSAAACTFGRSRAMKSASVRVAAAVMSPRRAGSASAGFSSTSRRTRRSTKSAVSPRTSASGDFETRRASLTRSTSATRQTLGRITGTFAALASGSANQVHAEMLSTPIEIGWMPTIFPPFSTGLRPTFTGS